MKIPTTIHARSLFGKHTAAIPSYEVVSMNEIVLATLNLDEAIEKFTDITKPTPVVEEIVIRNDKVNVFQVAERTEPSFDTQPDFQEQKTNTMIKLHEYIKIRLFYLGCFEHPLVAQVFYIIDADIERLRDLQAQVERLRQENKILRAEYGRQIIQRLSEIDTVSRRLFEKRTAGMPTVSKRILKASYTVPTFRRKTPLLWERFKYFR
jgi:hypothetical protein